MTLANVKDRTAGIGGSDVAAILGRSPWKTPLQVYFEKVGQADPTEENERMRWGNLLEDPVAREYAERVGGKVRRVNQTQRHPDYPYLMAHVDRRVTGLGDGQRRILEVKTTGAFRASEWGEQGSDEIPEDAMFQSMHYLGVTGADVCDVAALVGGQELRIYHVLRDDELVEFLTRECVKFWTDHVELEEPPAPTGMHEIQTRYREHVGGVMDADAELLQMIEDLAYSDSLLSAVKKDVAERKEAIALRMRSPQDPDALVGAIIDESMRELVTLRGHTRTKFRAGDFRADYPELLAEYTEKMEVRPFRLTKHGRALLTKDETEEP